MKDLQKRFAFTLAEVLITLGIIGVVAALTIPTLMANYQKVQEVAALKKSYAEITEALRLMANDHGCPDDLKCVGVFDDSNTLGNEFKKYFKLAKDCGATYDANDGSTKCMADSYSYNYDGSGDRYDMDADNSSYYRFVTADGFGIALEVGADNCANNQVDGKLNLNQSQVCGFMWVDVNGSKGPNNVGRDIFAFKITNGKGPAIYPIGGSEDISDQPGWVNSSGTPSYCDKDITNKDGSSCTARIMEQGWQMLY